MRTIPEEGVPPESRKAARFVMLVDPDITVRRFGRGSHLALPIPVPFYAVPNGQSIANISTCRFCLAVPLRGTQKVAG